MDSQREVIYDTTSTASRKKFDHLRETNETPERSTSTLSSIKSALLHPFGSDKSSQSSNDGPLMSGISPRPSASSSTMLLATSPLTVVDSNSSSSSVGVGLTQTGDEHILSGEPFSAAPGQIDRSTTPTPADTHRYPPAPPLSQTTSASSTSSSKTASTVHRTSTKTLTRPISSLLDAVKPNRLRSSNHSQPVPAPKERQVSETVAPKMDIDPDSSFDTEDSSNEDRTDYSMMEKSQTGDYEAEEISREFHEFFAMDKKEVLIER